MARAVHCDRSVRELGRGRRRRLRRRLNAWASIAVDLGDGRARLRLAVREKDRSRSPGTLQRIPQHQRRPADRQPLRRWPTRPSAVGRKVHVLVGLSHSVRSLRTQQCGCAPSSCDRKERKCQSQPQALLR
jgi:hypothetical protein